MAITTLTPEEQVALESGLAALKTAVESFVQVKSSHATMICSMIDAAFYFGEKLTGI